MEIYEKACEAFSGTRLARLYNTHHSIFLGAVLSLFLFASWFGNVMLIEQDSIYYNSIYDTVFVVLRYISYLLMGVSIIFSFFLKKYDLRNFAIYAVVTVLVFIFSRSTEFVILMLAIGSMTLLSRNRIFRIVLGMQIAILTIIPLLTAFGIFPNVNMVEARDRFNLGFTWVTSAPVLFVFVLITFINIYRKNLNAFAFAALLQISVFLYLLTDTRMAFIVSLGVLAIALLWKFQPGWFEYLQNPVIERILIWLPVALTVIGVLLAIFYTESGFMASLNGLLSGRLANTSVAWQKFGPTLFGQYIVWTGEGITFEIGQPYLFVDNSYLNILLNYGAVSLILVFLWCRAVIKKLYLEKNYLMIVLFAVILLFSFIEVRLINPLYNPFVIAAGSYLGLRVKRKESYE